MIPRIHDPQLSPVKGALIELMLPGIHLLTLVSVLDDALAEYIDINEIPWPPRTKHDLFHRIDVVSNIVVEIDRDDLQRIRRMRNEVAHPCNPNVDNHVSWMVLEEAIEIVLRAFLCLGQIEAIPSIVAFFEREPTLYLDNLGPNGERLHHKHRVGAKVNGEVLLEYTHEVSYFPPKLS